MKQELSLKSIPQVDEGRPAAAFDLALKDAVDDIQARGFDKKPRTVCLIVTLTPRLKDGLVHKVATTIDTKKNFPLTRSDAYEMALHGSGKLLFSDGEAEKAQGRFEDIDKETGEVRPRRPAE